MESKSLHQIIQLVETKLKLKLHSISLLIWKDRITERLAACHLSTYEEYEQYLQTSAVEMQELIELIVNLETWFFRERGAFDYLTFFIKQIEEEIPYFKILSVACSTGEEPYSIAMTLFDAGLSQNDFKIDALDISRQALRKAQIGIYREVSFRNKEFDFRDRYFNVTHLGYAIKEKVKKQVSFYESNILEEQEFLSPQSYQVIFCRNLLIYLHQKVQMELLNHLKDLLTPQGILIVGSAETKIVRSMSFERILFPSANAFKLKQVQKERLNPQPICEREQQPTLSLGSDHAILKSSSVFQQKSDKATLLDQALKRADEGAFEESMQLCFHFIRQYGADADIYYLLGLLHHAKGNKEQAKDCFHKAVYLKPSHYEALTCLALLYESQGEKSQAELFRKRALKYL